MHMYATGLSLAPSRESAFRDASLGGSPCRLHPRLEPCIRVYAYACICICMHICMHVICMHLCICIMHACMLYTMRVMRYSHGITCNAGDAFFFLPVARCVRVCLCGWRVFGHKRFGILTACPGACIDGVCYIAVAGRYIYEYICRERERNKTALLFGSTGWTAVTLIPPGVRRRGRHINGGV